MGIGKTTEVLSRIGQISGRVEIYVPTHRLASELLQIIKTKFPTKSVAAIAGRSAPGINGKPLCKKHKLAEQVAGAGGEVYRSLCKRERVQKGQRVYETCRHYKTCAYIQQFQTTDITVYSHAYLPLTRSRLEGPAPDYAVIDESFFQTCIEIAETPLRLLTNPALAPDVVKIVAPLTQALLNHQDPIQALTAAQIGYEDIQAALTALRASSGITPTTAPSKAQAVIPRMREAAAIERLIAVAWGCVLARSSQAIYYDAQKACIQTHRGLPIRHLQDWQPPGSFAARPAPRVLIIDRSASPLIVSQWFRIGKEIPIAAERNAHVIQCVSSRCATTSLLPERNTDPTSKKMAKRRLRDVQTFINHLAAEHRSVLVIGPQALTGAIGKKKKKLHAPANVEFAHFNAVRGVDRWKDIEAVVVIGRNEPPAQAVEDIARCVFSRSPVPLDLTGTWTTEHRGYRLASGEQLGTDVVVHADHRVQAVLEQLRERESEQALDRLRLIHAPQPKFVYLLSNLPLDVTVHQLLSWDALVHGSRVEQAWRRTGGGALPLDPEWLAKNYPDLWSSASAAKSDVQRDEIKGQVSNNIYIRNLHLNIHSYKPMTAGRTRQGKWRRFLSDQADPVAAQRALSRVIGSEVRVQCKQRHSVPKKATTLP